MSSPIKDYALLGNGETTACSCWMADCLSMQGRKEEARAQFERVPAVANDLGLLSEEFNCRPSTWRATFHRH